MRWLHLRHETGLHACTFARLSVYTGIAFAACKVSYQNKRCNDANQQVQLDFDVTSGYGPETITMLKPMAGTYRFYVHMFSTPDASGLSWSQSQAVVKECRYAITLPSHGRRKVWCC